MSLWDFARLAGSEDLREADLASLLATGLHEFGSSFGLALTPGAGLVWHDNQLKIVALADAKDSDLQPGILVPLNESTKVSSWVADALGGMPEWANLVSVLAINPPERQIAPGGPITGPSVGTIGTQVRWNNGAGFLTAGHVAPSAHASVYDGSAFVGTVAWSNDPAGHGAAIEPDVAVIELQTGVSFSNPIASARTAGPFEPITVLSSGASGVIMGLTQFLYMPNQHATCGDTYLTTSQITIGGDSGGPVMAGADVIGHVVGASPGVTSFVQDLGYQLREAANPLRAGLSGLRI